MLLLTQHLFGVFDEFGTYGNSRFPAFYRDGADLVPTSCTNGPVAGNFSRCDIDKDCLDEIEEGQEDIVSSLLYSTNRTSFPQVYYYNV